MIGLVEDEILKFLEASIDSFTSSLFHKRLRILYMQIYHHITYRKSMYVEPKLNNYLSIVGYFGRDAQTKFGRL